MIKPTTALHPTILMICLLATSLTACKKARMAPPMTPQEIARHTEGQPQIFIAKNNTLTLEGIEALYLGQPHEEAMAILNELCPVIETFDGGWRHNHAVFKGCTIDDDSDHTRTVRAGFWPHNGNRLSTLEIKDRPLSLPLVRARFTEQADTLTEDLPRRAILMMATPEYRLFANWDDGEAGAAHLIIGFQP